MTNEKLVELIDDQLQTQLEVISTPKTTTTHRYVEQRVFEETIVSRRIMSSIYIIA
jgi:hypothetical protein